MQSDPLVWVAQPCTGTPPAAICASASAFDPTSHTLYVIAGATFALDVARWVSVCAGFFFSLRRWLQNSFCSLLEPLK